MEGSRTVFHFEAILVVVANVCISFDCDGLRKGGDEVFGGWVASRLG
jgi:hypothetical protein